MEEKNEHGTRGTTGVNERTGTGKVAVQLDDVPRTEMTCRGDRISKR